MAEEFQGGVCGGNWWNSSRNLFGSSPCSSAINDIGNFGAWQSGHDLLMDMNTTGSNDDSGGSTSDGGSSVVLQDVTGNMPPSIDSTFEMMGISLSSSTTSDWNQDLLLDSGRSEVNYSHLLQEPAHVLNPSMNYRQQTGVDCPQIKDWSSNNLVEDSLHNSFKQLNQDFPIEQQPLYSISSNTSTGCAAITNQVHESTGYPMNSASFSYTSVPLLQTLFDTDSQPQQPLSDNLQAMNYSSAPNYRMINSNDFLCSPPKAMKPSLAKQQPADRLKFTNNTPYWNSTAPALNNDRVNLPSSTKSQFIASSLRKAKPNLPNFVAKNRNEESDVATVAKKASNETAFKRPRLETPSPLPTFKVRKEKLGDRITALQQLVSPFGKTDTASVLHEAIEYIKFLHDQVNVLSTPYMKNGSSPLQNQQAIDKLKDQEGLKQDLKSRGLCLVPISSTFPVASETTTDFWTPTFGGSFR